MGSGPESGGGILGKVGLSDKIKGVLPDGIDSVGLRWDVRHFRI
jgi:hypothetical protein